MAQALYRKYRSKSLDDVVGQDHIKDTLKQALKNGRISHAYLFSGPRGVGKTTVARILAYEVNDLDYKDDSQILDIIEIDAASNRRIDEIRDLRQKIHITPTSGKFKVYIIDEVHMLTREAFNALLKTLEEPPKHAIFILATTEPHKLPETIVSRTQQFKFRPISLSDAEKHLKYIAESEKINISPEAINMIARHGAGSFRDSISLLDQLSGSNKKIDATFINDVLGLPPANLIIQIVQALESAEPRQIIEDLDKLWDQGANPSLVANQVSVNLRQKLIDGRGRNWHIELLKQLIDVAASPNPREYLEISLLDAASRQDDINKSNDDDAPKPKSQDDPSGKISRTKSNIKPKVLSKKSNEENISPGSNFNLADWPEVISKFKSDSNSLANILKLAVPEVNEDGLVLAFNFPLHQNKVSTGNNVREIEKVIYEVTGHKVIVTCKTDKSIFTRNPAAKPLDDNQEPVEAINSIFGAVEMLES